MQHEEFQKFETDVFTSMLKSKNIENSLIFDSFSVLWQCKLKRYFTKSNSLWKPLGKLKEFV